MFHFHYITCTICCAALHWRAPRRIKGLRVPLCRLSKVKPGSTELSESRFFPIKIQTSERPFSPFASLRYDYVEVRDGVDESGQLVGKYCGKIAPSPVVSSGNQLFIKFVSDYETHGAGFSIRYEIFKTGGWASKERLRHS